MGSALAGPIHAAASRPLQPQENTEALLRGPLLHRRRLSSPSISSGGGIRTRDLRVMRSREGVPPKSGGAFQSGFSGLKLPQFRSEWNHEWNQRATAHAPMVGRSRSL